MPSLRVEIGPSHIDQARSAALARTYSSGDPLVIADVVEKGLSLRVQDGSVSWILKWNGKTKSLGKLADIRSAKTARERARIVRAMLKQGDDPTGYITSRAAGRDHEAATSDLERRGAVEAGEWTWDVLCERYVQERIAQPKITRGGAKPPSDASIRDAKRFLSMPQYERLKGKLLRDLGAADLEAIRDAILAANGGTASRKAINYSRAALGWAKRFHKGSSGLGGVPPWWTEVQSLHTEQPRTRLLSIEQIAQVLFVAEKNKVLPGRRIEKAVSDAVLAALWWMVLTAQRRSASMSILRSHILDDREAAGWKVIAFPAGTMKSKRFHSLPVPPRVVMLLETAMAVRKDSQWVFPSERTRRRGSDKSEDLHVFDSSVNLLIRRLRGLDPVGKARKAPDLLHGIPEFSPHDLRRSLATILSDMSVRGDAASAVLDHSSGVPGNLEFRQAEVTRLVYNQSQRLELKREAMRAWTEAVFAACNKAWGMDRKSLLRRLPHTLPWYARIEVEARRDAARAEAAAMRDAEAKASLPREPLDLKKLRTKAVDEDESDEQGWDGP